MATVVKSAWTMLVGWASVVLARRNASGSVVRALFVEESHGTAEKSTIRRTLFLTKKALVTLLLTGADKFPETKPDVLVLGPGAKEVRETYLREFGERGNLWMFSEFTCPNGLGIMGRLAGAGLVMMLAIACVPAPLFLRTNSAFERIAEIARAIRCIEFIRRIRPRRMYFFGSFDRNANLIAKLVADLGVKVIRLCSPNPLRHYHYCVANEFILTTPFQVPEYQGYRDNWFVDSVRLWRPVNFPGYPEAAYCRVNRVGQTIGVLSGSQWWRHERGDHFDEERMLNLRAEEALHHAVREYRERHPDTNLLVYPHPTEKADDKKFDRAVEFYTERFGSDRVEIVPPGQRTHERYGDADVLLALWSTSATEALYCGNKVLFARLVGEADVKETALLGVHAFDRETLWKRIDECLAMTAQEYFESFDLLNYRHDRFDAGPIPVPVVPNGQWTEEIRPASIAGR